jgi:hypothetical protein
MCPTFLSRIFLHLTLNLMSTDEQRHPISLRGSEVRDEETGKGDGKDKKGYAADYQQEDEEGGVDALFMGVAVVAIALRSGGIGYCSGDDIGRSRCTRSD